MYNTNTEMQLNYFKKTLKKFDNVRFKPYRIGLKLKQLQKESKFYLIDLFNTIESFREFGLNSTQTDLNATITLDKLEQILISIFHHFNRRSSSSQQQNIDIDYSIILIFDWLTDMFNCSSDGCMNVFEFKIALTLLCSSLLSNKLKYFFTLISDENGYSLKQCSFQRFYECLSKICNYFEGINNENIEQQTIFDFENNAEAIDLKQFIDVWTNIDNQNEQIQWLIVYHRLFESENVQHNIQCDTCEKHPIFGFRYKCKICNNYNQCQECFWYGRRTKNHDPDFHPCKEYLFDHSKRQQLRQSFRRSFRKLLPKPSNNDSNEKEDSPKKTLHDNELIVKKLNLSIESPTSAKFNRKNFNFPNFNEYQLVDFDECWSSSDVSLMDQRQLMKMMENDEHRLIEHYLKILQNENDSNDKNALNNIDNDNYEKIIMELERKNRQLMYNINEYKNKNSMNCNDMNNTNVQNDEFMSTGHHQQHLNDELSSLKQKKLDLEQYLASLQDQRKNLVHQLNDLMNELKINDTK